MNKNIFNLLAPIMSLVIASGSVGPTLEDAIGLISTGITMERAAADYKTAQERAPLEAIGRVLTNDAPFNTRDDEMIYLYDYFNCSSHEELTDTLSMAIVDMDADGRYEVVLKDEEGNSTVFRYEDGAVYAYAFSKKEMCFLKNDGTFVWSKGEYNNGYAKLLFSNNLAHFIELTAFSPRVRSHFPYPTMNNAELSYEAYNEFVLTQAGNDVIGYKFIEENICYLNELVSKKIIGQEIIKNVSKAEEAIYAIEQVLKQKTPMFHRLSGFIFLDDYIDNTYDEILVHEKVSICVVDFDYDNIPEVVLESNLEVLYVLHYYEGQVCMFLYGYRGMNDIRTDGTFEWSGGAAHFGTAKLQFNGYGAETVDIAMFDRLDFEKGSHYEISGKSVTYQEFDAFLAAHEEKESLKGYDYTDENISSIKNIFYNIPLDFN